MKRTLLILVVTALVIVFSVVLLKQMRIKQRVNTKDIQEKPDLSFVSHLPCKDCNILLISIEPLRFKNMGFYGYSKDTTPNLDSFSQEALIFDNFVSVSPWTLPAHMSLFTGVDPSRHKITNKIGLTKEGSEFENSLDKVSPDLTTLAEVLKKNGYKTAGFTGGAADAATFGFNKGFDEYFDEGDFVGTDTLTPKVENWIGKNIQNKFFIFLQGYDVHGQYVPGGGYDKRYLDFDYKGKLTGSAQEQKDLREEGITRGEIFLTQDDVKFLTALYDEKVNRMDGNLGKLFDYLKQSGLMGKTIILFTSGHGDEFYEHGRIDHGHSLYEELVHVPFIIRIPGNEKRINIHQQFNVLDIMPTIFDLIGRDNLHDLPDYLTGNSIIESLENGEEDKYVFLETDYRYSVFKRGVRTADGWKLVKDLETGQTQLFDLNTDPGEKTDLTKKETDKYSQLLKVLQDHLDKFQK